MKPQIFVLACHTFLKTFLIHSDLAWISTKYPTVYIKTDSVQNKNQIMEGAIEMVNSQRDLRKPKIYLLTKQHNQASPRLFRPAVPSFSQAEGLF